MATNISYSLPRPTTTFAWWGRLPSIGKFGADTDNWEWPRHTGDFSLFRIYAAPDGKPADYSPDNVPFQPRHHLPVSLDGVEPQDFTLVFGFPGVPMSTCLL
ncbi:MAG: S46 family peptidase [Saprospiraceae bacterium]